MNRRALGTKGPVDKKKHATLGNQRSPCGIRCVATIEVYGQHKSMVPLITNSGWMKATSAWLLRILLEV